MAQNTRTFDDGDVIFREGDPGDSAFTVQQGRVSLSKETVRGPVEIEVVGESAIIGEIGVLNGGRRTLTASAQGPVTVEVTRQGLSPAPAENKKSGSLLPDIMRFGAPASAPQATPTSTSGNVPVPGKGNWLRKLLSMGVRGSGFIEVRIMPFHGENGLAFSKATGQALGQCAGIRVRLVGRDGPFAQSPVDTTGTAACIAEATRLLQRSGGDLLIWGDMSVSATWASFHMASALPANEEGPASFNGFMAFPLPVDLSAPWISFLNTAVLAATVTKTATKSQIVHSNLESAIEQCMATAQNPPHELSGSERASLLLCLGNAVTLACTRVNEPEMVGFGLDLYRRALEFITADEHPVLWGIIQKQLGSLLFLSAERTRDKQALSEATTAFQAATETIPRRYLPLEWAAAQNRRGLALYSLDLHDVRGDTRLLESAVAAFCAAVQVYTRADVPDRWADVMNNYAQVTQVLGEHLHEPEILLKAVSACRNALAIKHPNRTPQLWAATQNTLGSALFLLGKLTRQQDHLDAATDAFNAACRVYIKTGANNKAAIIKRNLDRVGDFQKTAAPKIGSVPQGEWAAMVTEDEQPETKRQKKD